MRLRRHNEPGCPCHYPIACGLTPRWVDRRPADSVVTAVMVGYGAYVMHTMLGWVGIAVFAALVVASIAAGRLAGRAVIRLRDRRDDDGEG